MSLFPSFLFGWLFSWTNSLVSSLGFDEFLFIVYVFNFNSSSLFSEHSLKKKTASTLFYYHNNFLYLSIDSTNIL